MKVRYPNRHSISNEYFTFSELLEDEFVCDGIEDSSEKGVKFNVKYLGKCSMKSDCGEEETTVAIKEILDKAKEKNKKLGRVCVNITETAVIVNSTSGDNKDLEMDFSIQRYKTILKIFHFK